MKIQEIREIIRLIDQSTIGKFTYEADGTKIKLEKEGGQQATTSQQAISIVQPTNVLTEEKVVAVQTEVQVPQPVQETVSAESSADNAGLHKITSPMVGTFYAASSPEVAAYIKVGDQVTAEGIVCIVEAMKLFNEIEAEVTGEVVEILVQDGQLVEYGQPLFLVKTK